MESKLRNSVARGVAWTMAEKVGTILLQAAVGIWVARLLAPEDYGVMAILTIFATLSLVVVDSGFSQTLIRAEAPTPSDYRSVFGLNLLLSLLLYALMVALAPSLANFYSTPALAEIAPILFLLLPLNALCVIQQTLCARHFRFDSLSKVVFLSSLAGGVVALAMAYAGCGVWSLVGQRLAAMGSKAAMLWWVGLWRPEGHFEWAALRRMAPYSLRLLTTDLIATLYNNISQLFVGRLYSTQTLGYYNQGQKLKDLPVLAVLQSVQSVTFPALSKIKEQPSKFAASYRQLLEVVSFLLFPVMAGLVAVAPELFALLLGEKWMPTVPYFEVLCLSGLFMPLAAISYNVLKSRSDGKVVVRIELLKRVAMTLVLILTIPRGVMAIAWGVVAMAAIEWVVNLAAASRHCELSWWQALAAHLPALLLTAVMYLAVEWFAHGCCSSLSIPLSLALQILVGVLSYLLLALLFRPRALKTLFELAFKR